MHSVRKPAKEFEQTSGIAGISHAWVLPRDLPENTIESICNAIGQKPPLQKNYDDLCTLQEIRNELIRHNPDLSQINIDTSDDQQLIDLILGVTSDYNANDITHFIARPQPQRLQDNFRREALAKDLGTPVQWIPSPKTEEKIRTQYAALKSSATELYPFAPTTSLDQ